MAITLALIVAERFSGSSALRQSCINLAGHHIWQRQKNTGGFQFSFAWNFYVLTNHFQRSFEVRGSSLFIFALSFSLFLYLPTSAVTGWGSRKSSMSLLISPIAGKQARVITAARQSFRAEIKPCTLLFQCQGEQKFSSTGTVQG